MATGWLSSDREQIPRRRSLSLASASAPGASGDARSVAIQKLRQQLIDQAPGSNWNVKGIDRAQELAELMYDRTKGKLTDLSGGITLKKGRDANSYVWTQADEDAARDAHMNQDNAGHWGGSGHTVGQVVNKKALPSGRILASWEQPSLSIGGQDYGYINKYGSDEGKHLVGKKDGQQFAYSAKGDGGVRYVARQTADGKTVIVPQWTSSSDMDDVRTIGKLAATVFGGGYALSNALGGAGAAGVAEGAGMSLADAAALDAAEIAMTGGGGIGTGGAAGAGGALGAVGGSPGAAINAAQITGTSGLGESVGAAVANGGVPAASGAINPALIESATGTAGYGASSAGAGNGLSLAQGGLGMTGAQTSVYDAVIQATGSPQLANLASSGSGGLQQVLGNLNPMQKMQLANSLGSLAGSVLSGGGSSAGTGSQKAAGNLQMDIARQLQGLGTTELATARNRQATFDPQFAKIIEAALASQQTNDARSKQAWDEYTNYYMPAGRRMAETAANFDTAGRRAEAGAEARAGVDASMGRALQAQNRDLGRRGVSLSSGQSLARDMATRFAGAKASAAADTAARRDIENTGIALTKDVANFGNQTAGLGLNASNLALQGGNTAAGAAQARQSTYNSSLTPGMNALTSASSAAGGAGNTFNGVANTNLAQQQQDNQGYAGLGSLIGTLGASYFLSDPRTKEVHGKVSGKRALRTLEDSEVYDWTYKPGLGDGKRHVGRMAGEGDVDTPHGKAIDAVSEMGTHHAAIKELSREVKEVKRRLSLADAVDAKIIRRAA